MKKITTRLVFLAFSMGSVACTNEASHKVSCVAGVELLWKEPNTALINRIGDLYHLAIDDGAAGLRVVERKFVYIKYTDRCEQKDELILSFMQKIKSVEPAFPDFVVVKDANVEGMDWAGPARPE